MSLHVRAPWRAPAPLQRWLEHALAQAFQPPGRPPEDFTRPAGEPALVPPDSVTWRVCKNPVVLFIGGVAAVVLELAEPRVCAGVWEHTSFRQRPLERLRATGLATAVTAYGASSRARALIDRVARLHARVNGTTAQGQPYSARDPELLDWVHATAGFGFLQAHQAYVRPLSATECDRYYAESVASARLYGAGGTVDSQAALEALFARMRDRLGPTPVVHEFLAIVSAMPGMPTWTWPILRLLTRAAVQITPPWLHERLGLAPAWTFHARWQHAAVRRLARAADSLLLRSSPAVQACVRLGLPEDYLFRDRRHTEAFDQG
jgi:uncharacterized protein (DUF2236 family)